jgi:hypothetical protein
VISLGSISQDRSASLITAAGFALVFFFCGDTPTCRGGVGGGADPKTLSSIFCGFAVFACLRAAAAFAW